MAIQKIQETSYTHKTYFEQHKPVTHIINDPKVLTKYVWAFSLGDGTLFVNKAAGSIHAIYQISQLSQHEEYLLWQADILANLTSVRLSRRTAYYTKQGLNAQESISLTTKTLPFFTTMYKRIYTTGVKSIDPHYLKLLDWEVLAILYMDDGNIDKYNTKEGLKYRAEIATHSFTYADNMMLQRAIYEKTGIPFDVVRHKDKWRMRLRNKFTNDFLKGIKPYIFPSFYYKIAERLASIQIDDDMI